MPVRADYQTETSCGRDVPYAIPDKWYGCTSTVPHCTAGHVATVTATVSNAANVEALVNCHYTQKATCTGSSGCTVTVNVQGPYVLVVNCAVKFTASGSGQKHLVMSCSHTGPPPPPPPACDDEEDNDGDGWTDFPSDPGCDASSDTSESPNPACSDGLDNDGDTRTDSPDDPGCYSIYDPSERNSGVACDDGADNDGDGLTDFPADPGCASLSDTSEAPNPECSNGVDDDGNGDGEYPTDPDCASVYDNDEGEPRCSDRLDNDGDRYVDYPEDPGCDGPSDATEDPNPPCSNGIDDDEDGWVDFAEDPGCDDLIDTSEDPNPQCSNGLDDDGDRWVDLDDSGCGDIFDDDEGDDEGTLFFLLDPPRRNVPQIVPPPPESIRGTTPFSGGFLKPIFPCPSSATRLGDGTVNLASGEFVAAQCLLQIPGRGLGFDLELTYRSRANATSGVLGFGWDHSYNKWLEIEPNGNVVRHSGFGRLDMYRFVPESETYASPPGFYDEMTRQPDGTYRIRDRHGAVEAYNATGCLVEIADRNGNALQFSYDASGRLATVADALDRQVGLAYDGQGRLIRISDFAARNFTFTYDAAGNLVSITTPSTPEQPEGLTTKYRYTTQHLLTTVTDPEHETYLANVYNEVGRVARQRFGLDDFTFQYQDAPPVTDVTDRNGNLVRWFMKSSTEPVAVRKEVHTNRDLRDGEPDTYATTFEHTPDLERSRTIGPRGDVVELVYDVANPDRLQRGNVLRRIHTPAADSGADPVAPVVTTYTYEPRFNQVKTETDPRGNDPSYLPQNGGLNLPGRYTTTYVYDYEEATLGDVNGDGTTNGVNGNLLKIVHPNAHAAGVPHPAFSAQSANQAVVELLVYNEHGQVLRRTDPEGNVATREYGPDGYLLRVHADATVLNITTEYDHDLVGNVVSETDPRGNTTHMAVNARNLVTSVTSKAPFLYETRRAYDGNDRLVLEQSQNAVSIDETTSQVVAAHPFFNRTFAYDVLDRLVEETLDATRPSGAPASSALATFVTKYTYDKNGNRVLVSRPEAVNGTQPNDVESWVYDERNLVLSHTRGGVTAQFRTIPAHDRVNVNSVTNSDDTTTRTYSYDASGNLVLFVDGRGHAMRHAYDGLHRQVGSTDPLGNRVATAHDPAGNVVRVQRFDAASALLAESRAQYDELGRNYRTDDRIFDPSAGQPLADGPLTPGDGLVTSLVEHDRSGRVVRAVNDNAHESMTAYDGANRVLRTTDAIGNQVERVYDPNGNVVRTVETEISPEGLVPAANFTTSHVYDSLDRLIRTTDPLGHTQRTLYDSMGRPVVTTDARGPLTADPLGLHAGPINGPGNAIHSVYDGAGRLLLVSRELRAGGEGSGALVGFVNTTYDYDADGRPLRVTDGNGNPTTTTYDDLGRKRVERFADNTTNQFSYDAEDDLLQLVDGSGNVVQNTYDADKRLVRRDVTLAPGFVGTMQQRWEYDGLGRRTLAVDDNGAGDDATVLREYDSLGRILRERQNGQLVASAYDGLGNRLSLAYPDGRTVGFSHDALERIDQIADDGTLADYQYVGPGRVLERESGNGVALRIGYDADRRPTTFNHTTSGDALVVGFNYTYDRDGDRTTQTRWHRGGTGDVFAYDSIHRLVAYKRDSADPAAELAAPGSTTAARNVSYELDAAGNRVNVTSNGTTTGYVANEMNEYASVGSENRTYDANGNLLENATHRFRYDYLNRLREVERKSDNATIATYAYDAENRRVSKTVAEGTTAFYYDASRVVEERDAADATVRQYVYGLYIDEPIALDAAGARLYYHGDAQHNVHALTNATGAIMEGYQYADYGRQTVFSPGADGIVAFGGDDVATDGAASTMGNPFLFTGRRLDFETSLYHYRVRAYDPDIGRFLQRDPIGAWGDPKALGNAYAYVGNNPMTWVDPTGMKGEDALPIEEDESQDYSEVGWAYLEKNEMSWLNAILKQWGLPTMSELGEKAGGSLENVANDAINRVERLPTWGQWAIGGATIAAAGGVAYGAYEAIRSGTVERVSEDLGFRDNLRGVTTPEFAPAKVWDFKLFGRLSDFDVATGTGDVEAGVFRSWDASGFNFRVGASFTEKLDIRNDRTHAGGVSIFSEANGKGLSFQSRFTDDLHGAQSASFRMQYARQFDTSIGYVGLRAALETAMHDSSWNDPTWSTGVSWRKESASRLSLDFGLEGTKGGNPRYTVGASLLF